MTATQRIRVYAVGLIALVGLFVVGFILGPRRNPVLGTVFPGLEKDTVLGLEIQSASGQVTVERQGEAWVLLDNGQYPAREDRVQSLLDELERSRLIRHVTQNDRLWEDFGVTDDTGSRLTVRSRTEAGTDRVRTLVWGSPAAEPGLSYLRLEQLPDVYASDGELQFYLRQPASYWSYLRVLPEDVAPGNVIALSSAIDTTLPDEDSLRQRYAVEREVSAAGGNDTWAITSGAGGSDDSASSPVTADADAMARLSREVADLVGTDFARDPGTASLPVVGSISLSVADGREFVIEILEGDGAYFCRAAGPAFVGEAFGGLVYELSAAKLRRLFPGPDELAAR